MTAGVPGAYIPPMPDFEVTRSRRITADPARVRDLVDDLQAWQQWSPWEGLDDRLQRSYDGPRRGAGSSYAWAGNRRAGSGSMEIVSSDPERIDMRLVFERPFRADNRVEFLFEPVGQGGGETEVTWRMTGRSTGLQGLFGRLVPMDRLVGRDFERGLASLAQVAEA